MEIAKCKKCKKEYKFREVEPKAVCKECGGGLLWVTFLRHIFSIKT